MSTSTWLATVHRIHDVARYRAHDDGRDGGQRAELRQGWTARGRDRAEQAEAAGQAAEGRPRQDGCRQGSGGSADQTIATT